MNKSKMILAAVGGVVGVATLAVAFLAWSAYSSKVAAYEGDEETEGLLAAVSKATGLSRKPVYPCEESVKAIRANGEALATWREDATRMAAAGDKEFQKTTPAAFKTFVVADAKRLATLPGTVGGALVKPDFAFGPFKDLTSGDKMPEEAKLATLQRQWDDVASLIETLAASGVGEVLAVDVKTKAEEPPPETNRRRPLRKPAKKNAEPEKKGPAPFTYVVSFLARPAAFVKVLNALSTEPRFTVVEDFSLQRETDALAEALGGEKKEAKQESYGRRGRRHAVVVEKKAEEPELKNGIVTDPVLDAPFKVELVVSVYDFGSLEGGAEAAGKAGEVK